MELIFGCQVEKIPHLKHVANALPIMLAHMRPDASVHRRNAAQVIQQRWNVLQCGGALLRAVLHHLRFITPRLYRILRSDWNVEKMLNYSIWKLKIRPRKILFALFVSGTGFHNSQILLYPAPPVCFIYTRIGSDGGKPQRTTMYCAQNIHTHSNGTTAPSRKSIFHSTPVMTTVSQTDIEILKFWG